MALFFTMFLSIFFSVKFFISKKEVIKSLPAIILGLGISAFFWIPALLEKQNILLSKIPIADRSLYFVRLEQLITPFWGGYGTPTDSNGFSYQLGLAHTIILIFSIIFIFWTIFRKDKKNKTSNYYFYILFLTSIFFIFLLLKWSEIFWKLPFLSEINYPWTLLGPIGFLLSLAAGFFATQNLTKQIIVVVLGISIITVFPYAKPQSTFDKGDDFYLTNQATTTSSNELMPLWVKTMPSNQYPQKVEIINGKGEVKNLTYNSKTIRFNTINDSNIDLRVNIIYYPGWILEVNKKQAEIKYNNDMGVMEINIPSGSSEVSFSFKETPIRLISDAISLASLLFVVIVFFKKRFL